MIFLCRNIAVCFLIAFWKSLEMERDGEMENTVPWIG